MTETNPILSIVIPLYNEEKRLSAGFEAVYSYLKDKSFPWEIVLVDDGSRDKTYEMLLDIKNRYANVKVIRNEKNRGKGGAVKNGVLNAKGDIVYSQT